MEFSVMRTDGEQSRGASGSPWEWVWKDLDEG